MSEEPSEARISVVEREMLNVKDDIASIRTTLNDISRNLSNRGQISWPLIVSLIMAMLGIGCGALWQVNQAISVAVSPLAVQARNSEEDRNRLNLAVSHMQDSMREVITDQKSQEQGIALQLNEVETQFRAMAQQLNLNRSHLHQWLSLLWRRVYGEDFPGTVYYPDISQSH